MADLPKGRITGRFMHITADSEDGDANPDFTPAAGSVIIAPMVPVMRFPGQTPPLVGLMEPIICPVIGGLMYRPGTDATDVGDPLALGVTVPASDQPDGNPKVMLYEATFMFENRDIQPAPVAFMVPTDGVVDLSVPIPAAPEQPAIVAVSYVDASQAIAANAAAQGWATSASLKADNAASSATAAASSATAAQIARDTTLAAAILELRGTGQPGSTTETNNAPVGTYYTDTAGTAGAWRWLKTVTGSGSNKWTVVYGDTGWRNVTPDPHQLGETGFVRARRNGSQVELQVRIGADKSFSGISTGIVIPSGFIKNANMLVSSPARRTINTSWDLGATAYFDTVRAWGNLYFTGSITSDSVFVFNYPTDNPWPSVLPGTPA